MAASVESLENALTELRWNPEGLGEETYDAYLTLVANYPDYILLVTGDGMPMAPDDKGRRLAPVFTTNAAFEAFHREVLAEGKLIQPLRVTETGATLFPRLLGMGLHGLVFNCCGPQRPLAFVPRTIEVLIERIGKATPVEEKSAEPDFLALTAKAHPNGTGQGEQEDHSQLWRAVLDLEEWHFLVHPKDSADPYPFIANEGGKRCAFAFTGSETASTFAVANNLTDAQGGAVYISMKLPGAIEWIESAGASGQLELVHFNFGCPGFYCPADRFKVLCRYLNRFNF